jgi:hypothetical protein
MGSPGDVPLAMNILLHGAWVVLLFSLTREASMSLPPCYHGLGNPGYR